MLFLLLLLCGLWYNGLCRDIVSEGNMKSFFVSICWSECDFISPGIARLAVIKSPVVLTPAFA